MPRGPEEVQNNSRSDLICIQIRSSADLMLPQTDVCALCFSPGDRSLFLCRQTGSDSSYLLGNGCAVYMCFALFTLSLSVSLSLSFCLSLSLKKADDHDNLGWLPPVLSRSSCLTVTGLTMHWDLRTLRSLALTVL